MDIAQELVSLGRESRKLLPSTINRFSFQSYADKIIAFAQNNNFSAEQIAEAISKSIDMKYINSGEIISAIREIDPKSFELLCTKIVDSGQCDQLMLERIAEICTNEIKSPDPGLVQVFLSYLRGEIEVRVPELDCGYDGIDGERSIKRSVIKQVVSLILTKGSERDREKLISCLDLIYVSNRPSTFGIRQEESWNRDIFWNIMDKLSNNGLEDVNRIANSPTFSPGVREEASYYLNKIAEIVKLKEEKALREKEEKERKEEEERIRAMRLQMKLCVHCGRPLTIFDKMRGWKYHKDKRKCQ